MENGQLVGSLKLEPTDVIHSTVIVGNRKGKSANQKYYVSTNVKDHAVLIIDVRVDTRPDSDPRVGLSCTYPCFANMAINKLIATFPR